MMMNLATLNITKVKVKTQQDIIPIFVIILFQIYLYKPVSHNKTG